MILDVTLVLTHLVIVSIVLSVVLAADFADLLFSRSYSLLDLLIKTGLLS